MALEHSKPHLGRIGDHPEPYCQVPWHDDECDCGVDPDSGEEY